MGAEAAQPERVRSWDGVLRREVAVDVRVVDEERRSFEVIASSEALDSHGDVVKQFWDLTRYTANPVVLWNHNMFESSRWSMGGAIDPEDCMPIGYAEKVQVKGKKLHATLVLVKGSAEEEPLVDKLWRRVQQGVLRAVSVGFRPGSVMAVTNKAGVVTHYEIGSEEKPNELLETSLVPIGSNPQAVAKSIAFERKHLGRMAAGQPVDDGDEENEPMAMTAEEKAAHDKAIADAKSAEDRAQKAEALCGQLREDLKTMTERAKASESHLAKSELDALQGKKFTPAERAKLEALVEKVGIADVKALLSDRPDVSVTQRAAPDGEPLRGIDQPAPPSTEDKGDPGADIANEAAKRARSRAA